MKLAVPAFAALLAIWLILSVINQLPMRHRIAWIKRRDAFAAIPAWSFFAPNPGRTDLYLIYRDIDSAGTFGPWRIAAINADRSWLSSVWNPSKRRSKAFSDMVGELCFLAAAYDQSSVQLTLPYIAMLNVVVGESHATDARKTQFAVVESFGFYNSRQPSVIFESRMHRL